MKKLATTKLSTRIHDINTPFFFSFYPTTYKSSSSILYFFSSHFSLYHSFSSAIYFSLSLFFLLLQVNCCCKWNGSSYLKELGLYPILLQFFIYFFFFFFLFVFTLSANISKFFTFHYSQAVRIVRGKRKIENGKFTIELSKTKPSNSFFFIFFHSFFGLILI